MINKAFLFLLLFPSILISQVPYNFPINNINELIQTGTVQVSHSQFDIGGINDVFDSNDQSLARSANINPLVITLTFPFKVNFSGTRVLQTYSDGWWTLEVADTEFDLAYQTGSYALLVSMSPTQNGIAGTASFFSEPKRIVRLTVRRTTGDDYVHLNEWHLLEAHAEVEIESICTRPSQLWLLPNTSYEIGVYGMDDTGHQYRIKSDLSWYVPDTDLIILEEFSDGAKISAFTQPGDAFVSAQWNGLGYELQVKVVEEFKPKTAAKRIVNVALVIIDPPIEAEGGLRFHERFGWDDPVDLTNALADSLDAASGGAVDYQIVSTYDEPILYAALQGTVISVDSMYRLFLEPGWTTFHQLEQTGGFAFDYNGLLAAHDFCTQSDNKEIDEVWVYSMPFTGMYESRLTGEGAFWYNSPPLSGNPCIDQLPVMGFNYERGVAEAMHSFGHRVESAMVHTFGRWDYTAVEKNDWEIFASYDEAVPGGSNIGNIHFPPNGISDYDYKNPASVVNHAENWDHYPFLFDKEKIINCQEWGCSHLGYMSWWFHHLPHFTCKNKDGILNNWWTYIVDYNEGKLLEQETPDCPCEYVSVVTAVNEAKKEYSSKLYPNPARENAVLEMDFWQRDLQVVLYNHIGIEVRRFKTDPNSKQIILDFSKLIPGIYNLTIQDDSGKVLNQNKIVIQNH